MSVLSDEQLIDLRSRYGLLPIMDLMRAVADAAIAAERAARAEPFGYFKPEPFGCTDCHEDDDGAVALYEAPPAAPVVPEGWKPVLEAVMREMPKAARYYRLDDGNAPGHAHKVAGIWDSDNGDLAGKPCAWCLAWNTARAMLAAAPAPSQEPTT